MNAAAMPNPTTCLTLRMSHFYVHKLTSIIEQAANKCGPVPHLYFYFKPINTYIQKVYIYTIYQCKKQKKF